MLTLTPSAPPAGSPSEANSVFALLSLISDPNSAQARLKELTDKANEAAKWVEQAKAANVEMEAARKRAEDAKAQTDEAIRQLAAREADLRGREQKLTADSAALYQRQQALEAAKATFDKTSADVLAQHSAREQAIQQAEQEQAARFKQQQNDIQATLASKLAALEAEHRQRLDNARAAEERAKQLQEDTRQRAIAAVKAAADQAKALHESKLAELRTLGG